MKKVIFLIATIILAGVWNSCTLIMEEFYVPEEDKGIEEPYTQYTTFGNVTYQYHDDVTPINGDLQEYIAAIEHDSIIYFLDNLPTDRIPQVGGYIAANCSEIIPLGLNNKVLSVENVGGMIKVVTTPAQQEEVFKVLKINIDFDYTVPKMQVYDSLEIADSGISLDDSVMIDMSVFKKPDEATRADDTPKDTTITYTIAIPFKDFSFETTVSSTEHKKFHFYEDSELDIREEWTDSYSDVNIQTKLTYTVGPENNSAGVVKCENPTQFKDYLANVKKVLKDPECPWKEKTKAMVIKNLFIPIPSTPVSIALDFDGSVYFDVQAFGTVKYSYRSDTQRKGIRYVDGEKEEIDMVLEKGDETGKFKELYFGGSFDVYGRIRAGVGFIVGKAGYGGGAVVGVEFRTGIRGGCETEFIDKSSDMIDKENIFIEPYFSLSAYGKGIIVRPGKDPITLAEMNFLPYEKSHKITLCAQIDEKLMSKQFAVVQYQPNVFVDPKNVMEFDIDIGFKSLSWFDFFPNPMEFPAIRIYSGDISDGNFVTIIDNSEPIEAKKKYNFIVNAGKENIKEAEEYHVVPCIYNKTQNFVTEYRSHIMTFGATAPKISQPKIVQWFSRDLTEEDMEFVEGYLGNGNMSLTYKDLAEYAFTTTVTLKNARMIDYWGFNIKIYNSKDKVIHSGNYDMDLGAGSNGIWKSGKYTLIATFISNCKAEKITDGLYVIVRPYCGYTINGVSERKEFLKSKAYTLQYNYERDGGPYTVGQVSSIYLE